MRPLSTTLGALLLFSALEAISPQMGCAQADYGTRLGVRSGSETSYAPQGPGVMLGSLDPAVRKWYVPQELYKEYEWRQWQYTNYARNSYQRYVETPLEGDYF
ncbi:MAG: hypothetical protein HOI35_00475, partial [Woeseia sp.]|nr:hypothetical protein [Woeseia sp.]